ncbi:hypothetical protein COHA_005344 [Chlorella ohadii]|uniref:Uncharacterized protein n=1 Tax=Chlorella ohadii TaxID=2649997 RepID=A0AAD5DNL8_9CHLO|nr:hypothetical protein COHA_005344 [Chlorella ohadii]
MLIMGGRLGGCGTQVDWNGDVRTRIKVAVPEGPERDYFKQMMEEEYAQYEEDWEEDEEEDEKGQEEEGEGGAAGEAEVQQA